MSTKKPEVHTEIWHGCYDSTMKGIIVDDAFRHPAKMARKLCERIFDYGVEKGYWKPGDFIVDPFYGIGTTGICGSYKGFQVVGVELEEKFVDLSKRNHELHYRKLEVINRPAPRVIQGDSQKLSEILNNALGCVTSPPFAGNRGGRGQASRDTFLNKYPDDPDLFERHLGSMNAPESYGNTEGQINALDHGNAEEVIGAITSPPYSEARIGEETGEEQIGRKKNYGKNTEQIGSLEGGDHEETLNMITSPPYADSLTPRCEIDLEKIDKAGPNSQIRTVAEEYSEEQIGTKVEGDIEEVVGSITSPPYADSINDDRDGIDWDKTDRPERKYPSESRRAVQGSHFKTSYGDSNSQLGKQSGENYWQAMAIVYGQVFSVLKPGGTIAIVVKNFVKDKQIVPLCDQTAQLLEALGFTITDRILASLVKKKYIGTDMFSNEDQYKVTEKKSFFRRLHQKQYPHLRIDFEEVIFARKLD